MNKILLVEDDPEITRLLRLHFDSKVFALECCSSGHAAFQLARTNEFQLIILDIELPDMNGIEVCQQLRNEGILTPIMMLTCHSDESEKVLAFELGADDYVTKPFGIFELIARVKALLRRSDYNENETADQHKIIFKDLVIDSGKRKVLLKGQRIDLTAKEFDLIYLLASNGGKTFRRQELLQKVWGYTIAGYEHTVTSHINRLRIKVESDLNKPEYILTSWGVGYRFSE